MYKSLEQALLDLEKAGMLKRIHADAPPVTFLEATNGSIFCSETASSRRKSP